MFLNAIFGYIYVTQRDINGHNLYKGGQVFGQKLTGQASNLVKGSYQDLYPVQSYNGHLASKT